MPDWNPYAPLGERDDIPALLNAMDIFTLSSIGEAFAGIGRSDEQRITCVTTDVGDAPYLLDDCGILVPKIIRRRLPKRFGNGLLSAEEQDVCDSNRGRELSRHFFRFFANGYGIYQSLSECLSIR